MRHLMQLITMAREGSIGSPQKLKHHAPEAHHCA